MADALILANNVGLHIQKEERGGREKEQLYANVPIVITRKKKGGSKR